jgi:hypothetical protein
MEYRIGLSWEGTCTRRQLLYNSRFSSIVANFCALRSMRANHTIQWLPLVLDKFALSNWDLTVEKWSPRADLFDLENGARKSNVIFLIKGPKLEPWSLISNPLTNASGIGYYATNFHWPPSASSGQDLGALLRLRPSMGNIKLIFL